MFKKYEDCVFFITLPKVYIKNDENVHKTAINYNQLIFKHIMLIH